MAEETKEDLRKYMRFSASTFINAEVCLVPIRPLLGDPASGVLVDLSAGGMGVLLHELIPRNIFLKLMLTFSDHSKIESIVKVRYVKWKSPWYFHGFEFLNPAPEVIERIDSMAKDYLACEDRIEKHFDQICMQGCAFAQLCTKKERLHNNQSGAILKLEPASEDPFREYREKFHEAA